MIMNIYIYIYLYIFILLGSKFILIPEIFRLEIVRFVITQKRKDSDWM